jgi:hypothetical protein
MKRQANEFLDDQSRDFHDTHGMSWRVRIEQGGGRRGQNSDAAPAAVLVFRALNADQRTELPITGDIDQWDLASYSEPRLRALLAQAQTHAAEPGVE